VELNIADIIMLLKTILDTLTLRGRAWEATQPPLIIIPDTLPRTSPADSIFESGVFTNPKIDQTAKRDQVDSLIQR